MIARVCRPSHTVGFDAVGLGVTGDSELVIVMNHVRFLQIATAFDLNETFTQF